jgi:hypothetical protein
MFGSRTTPKMTLASGSTTNRFYPHSYKIPNVYIEGQFLFNVLIPNGASSVIIPSTNLWAANTYYASGYTGALNWVIKYKKL